MEERDPRRILTRLLEGLVALVLFAMMALVFTDVLARYLFAAPLPGGFEITELLMGTLIFCALPLATGAEKHVTISLFDGLFKGRAGTLRQVVINLTAAGVLAVLARQLWRQADKLADWGDYTADLAIPIAPFVYLFAVMSGLSALLLALLAWEYARGRRQPGHQPGGEL